MNRFTKIPADSKRSLNHRRLSGFTLFETLLAASILALFVCGSLAAFAQANRFAAAVRFRTLALAVAQQKVDAILTTPWDALSTIPSLLAVGTQTETIPLDNDTFNNSTGLSSAFTTLDLQVNATRTTLITSTSARMRKAVVNVAYTYRGTSYNVSLTTLRAINSI